MAAVFPDAAACLENIPGDRQIPDHPLVSQTVRDCLEEAMDFEGLRSVLGRIHRGELRLVARDTPEPSLFAHEILNAKPYAFLDDAPLEERRSHAVQSRRATEPASASDLGALDAEAIARVREEERPDPRDGDELHDAMLTAGFLTPGELDGVRPELLAELTAARRAGSAACGGSRPDSCRITVAAERLPELLAIHPDLVVQPSLQPPPSRLAKSWTRSDAIAEVVRGRVTLTGPVTAAALAGPLGISSADADAALLLLEADGVVLRGRFSPGETDLEWCDRTLLARIHRYTLNRLRAEIEPVSPADFMRFLFRWQHVETSSRLTGLEGLREVVAGLDGYELAAGAWERAVLPARLDRYDPSMLDMICLAGEAAWGRLSPAHVEGGSPPSLVPATPIALFLREHAGAWRTLRTTDAEPPLGETARRVLAVLQSHGASFFGELYEPAGSTPTRCAMESARWWPAGSPHRMDSPDCEPSSGLRADARHSTIAAATSRAGGRPLRQAAMASCATRRSSSRLGRCSAGTGSSSDGCSCGRRMPRRGANSRACTVVSRRAARSAAAVRDGHVGRAVRASGRGRTATRGSPYRG